MITLSNQIPQTLSDRIPELVFSECRLMTHSDNSWHSMFTDLLETMKFFWQQCDSSLTKHKIIEGKLTEEKCCFRIAPTLKSNDALSDQTWNFLGRGNNFRAINQIFRKQPGSLPRNIRERLFDKVQREIHTIAEKMGATDPKKFIFSGLVTTELFENSSFQANICNSTDIRLDPEYVYALNGWPSHFTASQASGVLAHEVAHGIFQHFEKRIAERDLKKLENLSLNHEVQADFLATTVPEYGRGFRDFLINHMEKCNQKGFHRCSSVYKQSETHPSMFRRVEYLTESLCTLYPSKNRDICPDSLIQRLRNVTCPVFL